YSGYSVASMSHTEQANKECDFKWGKKGLAGKKKDVQFYESFTYDGVEYFLYDCVYLYVENEPEPYIGKLMKMWENPDNSKKGKVVWFFKQTEIRKYLHCVPLNNEIFLASGEGRGLFNVNHLDVLNGKCNVVCTSKDRRNPQPSEGELKRADYIFYRTFDVGKFKISDKFDDEIAGVDVRNIFNRKKGHSLANLPKIQAKASCGEAPVVVEKPASVFNKYWVKDERNSSHPVENKDKLNPSQDSKHFGGIQYVSINNNGSLSDSARALKEQNVPAVREQKSMVSVAENLTIDSDEGKPRSPVRPSEYKRKAVEAGDLFGMGRNKVKFGEEAKREKGIETISQVSKVTRKQEITWEERLLREYEKGTLVLFQNLDPFYTAEEIQVCQWAGLDPKPDLIQSSIVGHSA
ncbi:hypothetical protein IFM89_004609, partial [Coptis chinensis]